MASKRLRSGVVIGQSDKANVPRGEENLRESRSVAEDGRKKKLNNNRNQSKRNKRDEVASSGATSPSSKGRGDKGSDQVSMTVGEKKMYDLQLEYQKMLLESAKKAQQGIYGNLYPGRAPMSNAECTRLINEKLEKLNLMRIPIPKDGNCLFNAMLFCLGRPSTEDHLVLRKELSDFILDPANKNRIYNQFKEHLDACDMSIEEYADGISKKNIWGDQMAVLLLSQMLQKPIIALGPDVDIKSHDNLDMTQYTLVLLYENWNHFNATMKLLPARGKATQSTEKKTDKAEETMTDAEAHRRLLQARALLESVKDNKFRGTRSPKGSDRKKDQQVSGKEPSEILAKVTEKAIEVIDLLSSDPEEEFIPPPKKTAKSSKGKSVDAQSTVSKDKKNKKIKSKPSSDHEAKLSLIMKELRRISQEEDIQGKDKQNIDKKTSQSDNEEIEVIDDSSAAESHDDDDLTCEECKKTFKSRAALKKHEIFHGPKQYRCNICKKEFFQKVALQNHMRVHSDNKLKCRFPGCTKEYLSKASLKSHESVHTGDYKFKCPYCDRGFTNRSHFLSHKTKHAGFKPFKCGICNQKSYQHSAQYHRHLAECQAEHDLRCGKCNQIFGDIDTLKKHMGTHK